MVLINILTPSPDFYDVVRRMMTGDRRQPRPVAWTSAHNLLSDDPRLVVKIMRVTAILSVRCQRPVYAFTIAWHADESPTPDIMRGVVLATLERAGLADHQAFLICPSGLAHPCVRVVVNRVNPETGRAWSTSLDYRRFETIAREIATEYRFRPVPSRRTRAAPV